MDIFITVLIMVFCVLAEGFFSGSEIGVVSADKMALRHAAANGSRGAKLALKMLEKPEWLLSTTLVGTNISVVTNTTMATALVITLFGESFSWLAVVVVAPLIWVFGEIVPKSIFQQRANVITPRVIFALRAASILFWPILVFFSLLTRILARILGGGVDEKSPFILRQEIETMMEMSPVGGDIQPSEQRMIRRVFQFSETTAEETMIPLIDVVGIEEAATCGEATRLAVEKAHKRLPVYNERVDRIVGVVNTLDLLGMEESEPIAPKVRPLRYVPGSRSIENILLDMRRDGGTVVVVVDEFGGAEGIVTLEDIIEEVVGDLEDEYDTNSAATDMIRRIDEHSFLVSARVDLEELEESTGIALPDGDYETVAGFIIEYAKEIPPQGTTLKLETLTLVVEKSTAQAINEVRIIKPSVSS